MGNPLTETTIFPNLSVLNKYFSDITLTTVERDSESVVVPPEGIEYKAFKSATYLPHFLTKLHDLVFYTFMLSVSVWKKKPDLIICRGSMAAIFGFMISRLNKIPFMVESFEPHADYMAQGGAWSRKSLFYKFQKMMEKRVMQYATCLMPVSNNYKNYLIKTGVDGGKISVMPCCVDLQKFAYNEDERNSVRLKLGISTLSTVGVYVGKFGDLYLNDESFEIFKKTREFFKDNFFLIILTPQTKTIIKNKLIQAGFADHSFFVDKVEHFKVSGFLSASDFAFSLVRSSESSQFCSPVKNGEYWANGLPIILPKKVGDDEDIIKKTNSGAVFDPYDLQTLTPALEDIHKMIKGERKETAKQIAQVASSFRNFAIVENEYKKVLTKFGFTGYTH